MRSVRHFFEQSWLLIVASFAFGLLIAATNAALTPRIERNKLLKLTNLARGLLPDATDFEVLEEPFDIRTRDGKTQATTIFRATAEGKTIGWVFRAVGFGFADKIELVLAADAPFQTLAGFDVLASNETPGFGDQIKQSYFRSQFQGAPAGPLTLVKTGDPAQKDANILAISGATVSSTAVVDAINDCLPQIEEQLKEKGLIGNGS